MPYLITGGAGFIGTNLVEHLLQQDHDHRIRVLDDLSTGNRGYLDSVLDRTNRTIASNSSKATCSTGTPSPMP